MVDRGSGGVQLGWLKVSQSLVSFYSLKDPLVLGCITMSTISTLVRNRLWANEGGNVGQQSTHTAYLEKRVAYVLDLIERARPSVLQT